MMAKTGGERHSGHDQHALVRACSALELEGQDATAGTARPAERATPCNTTKRPRLSWSAWRGSPRVCRTLTRCGTSGEEAERRKTDALRHPQAGRCPAIPGAASPLVESGTGAGSGGTGGERPTEHQQQHANPDEADDHLELARRAGRARGSPRTGAGRRDGGAAPRARARPRRASGRDDAARGPSRLAMSRGQDRDGLEALAEPDRRRAGDHRGLPGHQPLLRAPRRRPAAPRRARASNLRSSRADSSRAMSCARPSFHRRRTTRARPSRAAAWARASAG